MALKKGLGRGLDALLGDFEATPAEGVSEVDIHLIDTNASQPRKSFDEEKLRELAGSIERHGVVQPLIVRRHGERYMLVAGERRFRAARMAGLSAVPVVVKDIDDDGVMEVALIENIQRENLNPVEEAAAIRFLMKQHDLTQEEVASRLSKSRPAIANSLRLLSLPERVQDMLREGTLTAGHARALAGLRDEEAQKRLAEKIANEALSVRDAENLCKDSVGAADKPKKPAREAKTPDRDIAAAEDALRDALGTRVSIQGEPGRGRIIIEYFSKEELQVIYEKLI